MKHLINFFKDEEGVTAIEYGLIAGLVVIGCVAAFTAAGGSLAGMWNTISDSLDSAAS